MVAILLVLLKMLFSHDEPIVFLVACVVLIKGNDQCINECMLTSN